MTCNATIPHAVHGDCPGKSPAPPADLAALTLRNETLVKSLAQANREASTLRAAVERLGCELESLTLSAKATYDAYKTAEGERDAASIRELALLEVLTAIQDYCGHHFGEQQTGFEPVNIARRAIVVNERERREARAALEVTK